MPRLRALRPRPQVKRDSLEVEVKEDIDENETSNDASEQVEIKNAEEDKDDQASNASLKDTARNSEKADAVERVFECKSCKPPKRLPSLKVYLQHCKNYHKEKEKNSKPQVQCSTCSFTSTDSKELESHQKIHHLKRRFFRCAKCSYVTHVRARYTKHVKYHSMPMIKCASCDFRTPYKWNLDRHTRNHGGGGAYQCRACNFTADIRQSLTVHETNHHEPPVGQPHRKSNYPFERKPRNSPKRHNQVGASDYRESALKSTQNIIESAKKMKISEDEITDMSIQEERNIMSDADCIALKCEEQGCQFITAWNSEMQRHVAETHTRTGTPNKSKKPLPMLIPLSPASSAQLPNPMNDSSATLLKVPRVRVRPELAQIARDNEMAKLYGNKKSPETKKESDFEKKNASFFDKLKEKLISSTTANTVIQEVAVNGVTDLKCWCTFEASSPEELASHKQTHHAALSVSLGVARCPKCRKCFKHSADLQVHTRLCRGTDNENNADTSTDNGNSISSYRGEYTFPAQGDWDINYGGANSATPPVEGVTTNATGRRVFKCPNCPFWASTASRFHVHIVGHLNRKPFECSLCAYRSNWRWDITKHIKLKAARDPAHTSARVLMTDETGRRNYTKYNKYLAQIEQQSLDDHGVEDHGMLDSTDPPGKVLVPAKDVSLEPARGSVSPLASVDVNSSNLRPRPLPPLKVATRSHGQSLLKNNPFSSNTTNGGEETRRTLWKCKRCNFRDSNKEAVVLHVKMHYEKLDRSENGEKNMLSCGDCPFSTMDASTLALHRVHHRPNLEAIFKCYLCPYYVSTKEELLEHARLHGEELAVEHQRNMDFESSSVNCKSNQSSPNKSTSKSESKDDTSLERVYDITSPTTSSGSCSSLFRSGPEVPPFLLDTRALPEAPLVWVSRPNGILAKMLKCRHCPYISSRRAEVRDHETMHTNSQGQSLVIACPNCSFMCSRREVMESHVEMHSGALGTVHCLVDDSRPDAQQVSDLSSLLGLPQTPELGPEPDLRDTRLVHCCGKCPARFLCEKELRIHLRYHSTELAYTCQWCSYAARQPAHLLAHQKAHSSEYQERTRYLLSVYGFSQRHPPPPTACIEANAQTDEDGNTSTSSVAWIVLDNTSTTSTRGSNDGGTTRTASQVFTCTKCPARYFKLDALEYHMTLHGSNNRFKCTECDYSSKTAQNLLKHQVVHRRHVDPTACVNNNVVEIRQQQQTQPVTQSSSRLSTHHSTPDPQFGMFMHGNPNFVYPGYLRNGRFKEKRYKCHKCPSAFEKREQYRVHLTLHGANQKYRCDMCDYSVRYYANYVQHVKKHEANAQAQASQRRFERDELTENEHLEDTSSLTTHRSSKSLKKSPMLTSSIESIHQSTQDKQTVLLMRKKNTENNLETLRCQNCPFTTNDKDAMDAHKRRHGIERLTPSCPHCDYVPRKEENIDDHIKLHFTRLYKPESYIIIESLSLTMRRLIGSTEKEQEEELLFKECSDDKFVPEIISNKNDTKQLVT